MLGINYKKKWWIYCLCITSWKTHICKKKINLFCKLLFSRINKQKTILYANTHFINIKKSLPYEGKNFVLLHECDILKFV